MPTRSMIAGIATVSLFCSACLGDDETTVELDPPPAPPVVEGSSWVLIGGGGPEGDVTIVDGYPITIAFEAGQLTGVAACNSYGGSYRLDGSGLVIEDLSWTAMLCEPPEVMESERRYLSALQDVVDLAVSGGQLALGGEATELSFTP